MKNKITTKAFTLIELLVVIIILGIIALITIPLVSDVVEKSEKDSAEVSAQSYIKGVISAVIEEGETRRFTPDYCVIQTNGNIKCDNEDIEIKVKVSGIKPTSGEIYFENREISNYSMIIDGYEITSIPKPKSFKDDSWGTIAANVKAGNLSAYKVGDTKEVAITGYTNGEADSNGLYTVRIANTKTPKECNQAGFSQSACGFVIEFVDIITTHNINPSATSVGGLPATEMYKFLNDTTDSTITSIYESLPEDLQQVIKPTQVVSSHGSSNSTNFTSTDKLYLLSTKEVYGTSAQYDTVNEETRQLDYYKDYKNSNGSIGVTTSNSSGAIKNYNGTANYWWLRSARSASTYFFYCVSYSGDRDSDRAYYTAHGVVPAFRIG